MQILEIPKKDNKSKHRKRRVAAYARVSMDKEAAFHSFCFQKQYYRDYIMNHPEWELVGIYADNAISGTTMERPEFTRLLEDCRKRDLHGNRKIDMIITKSISRFARNTSLLLSSVRELKSLGIDVYFEKEDLHSISLNGELLITLIAMFAEEEAKSASKNMRWHIKKRFENGEPWVGKMLGYRLENHKLVIVEEEAKIVREIFALYLSGWGKLRIAKYLQKKYPPTADISVWSYEGVMGILSNEKYKGDMLLQKTYRKDYRSKKDIKVRAGEVEQYYITSSHTAIIPPEIFEKVQNEIKRRSEHNRIICNAINEKHPDEASIPLTTNSTNPFKGMVVCNKCNHNCMYKNNKSHGYSREIMICSHHYYYGNNACTNKAIPINILLKETCQILHLKEGELSAEIMREKIKEIRLDDKRLIYTLVDGETIIKDWQLVSRSKSWTKEMREKARQKNIEYHKLRLEASGLYVG